MSLTHKPVWVLLGVLLPVVGEVRALEGLLTWGQRSQQAAGRQLLLEGVAVRPCG